METIQQTASVLRREDESREDVTWFRASTPDVDRHGTIIKPNVVIGMPKDGRLKRTGYMSSSPPGRGS